MRVIAAASLALALAGPAQAALKPGRTATIDVAVATLWKAPGLYRAIDRPSLTNPVDPLAWTTDVLTKLVNRWPASRIDELMPWAYAAKRG